jgi:hypothetical protein
MIAILGAMVPITLPLAVASLGYAEPKIGVLTLHGVGSQREGSDFDASLRRSLQVKSGQKVTIVMKSVYYHGGSLERQDKLWHEYDRLEDADRRSLDQKIIRRVMLRTLADALAYSNNPRDACSFYRRAHEKVREAVDQLETELAGTAPVAVVAHSLGCKVIFDYLCDAQTGQGIWEGKKGPSEFQQLATLRLLITTGCSLPFFQSATPEAQHRFFRPHQDFKWINFYDRDDLLGWPLRPLGGRFEELVQDEERNRVGSILTSHIMYWRHEELNEEIAEKILELRGSE